MLRSGANLLLLGEPANDRDIDTLRALEEALEDFAGCAMIAHRLKYKKFTRSRA